ncbi:MAG TPA: hypothetical protein VE604_01370, partial [Candidatus Polarisedimenticolia bacterium]|nr:hypothetical protein [Candidatus Polarisedimenticolia bacterium]
MDAAKKPLSEVLLSTFHKCATTPAAAGLRAEPIDSGACLINAKTKTWSGLERSDNNKRLAPQVGL